MKKNLTIFLWIIFAILAIESCAPKGDTGPKGETGTTGDKGAAGVNGTTGPKGATGNAGPKGDTGVVGEPGIDGSIKGFNSGWQDINWKLQSDVTTSGKRVVTYSFEYTNDKITDNVVKDGFHNLVYTYNGFSNSLVQKVSSYFSTIDNDSFYLRHEIIKGKISFTLISEYAISNTDNVTKLLEEKKTKFYYSVILN